MKKDEVRHPDVWFGFPAGSPVVWVGNSPDHEDSTVLEAQQAASAPAEPAAPEEDVEEADDAAAPPPPPAALSFPRPRAEASSLLGRADLGSLIREIISDVDPLGLVDDGDEGEPYADEAEQLSWTLAGAAGRSLNTTFEAVLTVFNGHDILPTFESREPYLVIAERILEATRRRRM